MSTSFPTNLDTLTNPTATDKVATVDHAAQHANANDAIEALEAKVGKNSSGVTTSHDYKLSGVTGSDKAVSITGNETLTNKTLTTPVLTRPKVGSIDDTNGNEAIKVTATASAVNEIGVVNAATGNDPLIQPTGDDTDIGVKIKGKGAGKVKLGDAELQMPDTDGSNGELLKTNGSGVLGWVAATTVPDADETTAGLVEEATTAEVIAGTATGSTGAKLFITPAKLIGARFATTEVHNAATPTSYTDLDLSAVIGATQKVVLLKVVTGAFGAGNRNFNFRPNGDTGAWTYATGASGCANLYMIASNAGWVTVKTDTAGIIEWECPDSADTSVVKVEAYW